MNEKTKNVRLALIGRAIASPAVKLIDTKVAFKFRV